MIYYILKALTRVLVYASDDLLVYSHPKRLDDRYMLPQNCAPRIQQAVNMLEERQVQALHEWKSDLKAMGRCMRT